MSISNLSRALLKKQVFKEYGVKSRLDYMSYFNFLILNKWQPRFYDHIIRDNDSLNRIRKYIKNNPKQREQDAENIH